MLYVIYTMYYMLSPMGGRTSFWPGRLRAPLGAVGERLDPMGVKPPVQQGLAASDSSRATVPRTGGVVSPSPSSVVSFCGAGLLRTR